MYRPISKNTAPMLAPAHLVAAAEEVGVPFCGGPANADLSECEFVVISQSGMRKGHPYWNVAAWEPDYACPSTYLSVRFYPHGAIAELRQSSRAYWCVLIVIICIGIAATAAGLYSGSTADIAVVCLGFVPGFILWPVVLLVRDWRARRTDPRVLWHIWTRAIELGGLVTSAQLPKPKLVTLSPNESISTWPEENVRRGFRVYANTRLGIGEGEWAQTAQAAGCDLYRESSDEGAILVVTLSYDAAAKYRGRRCKMPHVRLIAYFAGDSTKAEIRIQGVQPALTMLAAALPFLLAGITLASSGEFALLIGGSLSFAIGLALIVGTAWRAAQLFGEARSLRHIWEKAGADVYGN